MFQLKPKNWRERERERKGHEGACLVVSIKMQKLKREPWIGCFKNLREREREEDKHIGSSLVIKYGIDSTRKVCHVLCKWVVTF